MVTALVVSAILLAPPGVGDTAPPMVFEKILQAPPGASLAPEALKDKVLVMDFWATWCGPCIASFPHLNKLVAEMKDQPCVFVGAADEDESKLKTVTDRTPLAAWIAIDSDKSVWKDFQVREIPDTVVINKAGVIAYRGMPKDLSADMLREIVKGKLYTPLDVERERAKPLSKEAAADVANGALPRFEMREVEGGSMVWHAGSNGLSFENGTVRALLAWLADVPERRIVMDDGLAGKHVCLTVSYAGDVDDALKHGVSTVTRLNAAVPHYKRGALEMVAGAYGIELKRERRATDGWVVRRLPGTEHKLAVCPPKTVNGMAGVEDGTLTARNQPAAKLADQVSELMDAEVRDDTGLTGVFDWTIPSTGKDVESVRQMLREKAGLDLVPQRTEVEVLTVAPVSPPAPAPVR